MALKLISNKSYFLAGAIMLILAQINFASNIKKRVDTYGSWEIGFSGGVSKFLLSNNPNPNVLYKYFNYWNSDFNGAISITLTKKISPIFSAEIEWLTTKLSGRWDKSSGYPIPLNVISQGLPYPTPYKTGINQFQFLVAVNLNQLVAPRNESRKWYMFAKAGGGLALLKTYNGVDYLVGTRAKIKYAIVYGGGFSYKINSRINIKLGTTMFTVETDRLDGLHTTIPGLQGGPDIMIKNVNERYFISYVGMSYRFGKTKSRLRNVINPWIKLSAKKHRHRE